MDSVLGGVGETSATFRNINNGASRINRPSLSPDHDDATGFSGTSDYSVNSDAGTYSFNKTPLPAGCIIPSAPEDHPPSYEHVVNETRLLNP